MNDGKIIPDITIANEDVWGTWPNTGEMRLDYEWDREVTIDSSRVQFTSDDGGLGIPASWELQYWDAWRTTVPATSWIFPTPPTL